jgi:hypothetical protein
MKGKSQNNHFSIVAMAGATEAISLKQEITSWLVPHDD